MIKKNLPLLLFLIISLVYSQEQDCNCIDELDTMSKLIKNSKSYKTQIKKEARESDFNVWKEEIKREIANDSLSKFFCVGYLQKYISFIEDKHNQVYFIPDNITENVPAYSKEIDTTLKSTDQVSGIYYAGSDKVLVQKENDTIWYGITLKSDSKEWTKGKIRLRIEKTANNNFEIFEYFQNGLLFYQKNIEILNGRIHSTFWNKDNNYFFNKNFKDNFTYKSINSSFDYVGIKTLRRTSSLMKEAATFYENNLEKLTRENLIIDLRNNGGGSINQLKPLIKSLKRNKTIRKIYVLINFKTGSSAELATLALKEDKRTIIAGENSRGMVAYGYGNNSFSAKTNCLKYNVVLSTKRSGKYGRYENIGIKPNFELDNKSDWIDQIVKEEIAK